MDGINYFLPGQLWSYDTRPGEEKSTLTVLQVDDEETYCIVHVRLEQLNFFENGCVSHMPFSAEALLASITGFEKHLDEVPYYQQAYEEWKKLFDAGRGGYWKIEVKHAVESLEQFIRKKS